MTALITYLYVSMSVRLSVSLSATLISPLETEHSAATKIQIDRIDVRVITANCM